MKQWFKYLTWHGRVERGPYLAAGFVLMAVKYGLDAAVARFVFGYAWAPYNYFRPVPVGLALGQNDLPEAPALLGVLTLQALPFMFAGVMLTVQRLRDARLPAWLSLLFFMPYVNVLFFGVLGVLPSRPGLAPYSEPPRGVMARLVPKGRFGSALVGMLATLPPVVGFTVLSASVMQSYGWGLFVTLPFGAGLAAVLIHSYHGRRTMQECLSVAGVSALVTAGSLIALAVEGVVCVAMAFPFGAGLALAGGAVGFAIQEEFWTRRIAPTVLSVLVLLVPALMGAEAASPEPVAAYAVTSAVEIAAPPERVWEHVIAFPPLPEPTEWLFRLGVAYPVRAEIRGEGVGAVRHCVFSTGPFIEPIGVWEAPRRLAFSVIAQPLPMRELTPYSDFTPPHLDSFMSSERGEFRLTPLPGGRTRLEGTTWYTLKIGPSAYWAMWTDAFVHAIHMRVLRHIQRLAEG